MSNTFKCLANTIQPGKTEEDWFLWPQDIFALISIVFQRTGCYKICIQDEKDPFWNKHEYIEENEIVTEEWIQYVSDNLLNEGIGLENRLAEYINLNQFINKFINKVFRSKTDLIEYRNLGDYSESTDFSEVVENSKLLVQAYALADECCAAFGLLGQYNSKNISGKMFKYVSNILLNSTGSLSTISKFWGIVLPKMRTPQNGLNIRNMSFHLTFHQTEVEVIWRAIPWLNNHQKKLNILAIPFPFKISNNEITLVNEKYQNVRYFNLNDHPEFKYFANSIVDEIMMKLYLDVSYDIVIFPECSLSEGQYRKILNMLLDKYTKEKKRISNLNSLPLIIAGIINTTNVNKKLDQGQYKNELRMATFFMGYWYDISQRKHHKWFLDNSQIQQYGLENKFVPNFTHFENIKINQRRLHVIAPNGWLALTSLICEDLARQEPVAEVIRGIGPTLLFALLSDGPQLTNRWSARYANSLADDPGTSVFTLTSNGMCKLSRTRNKIDNKKTGNIIGLWKDSINGWKEVKSKYEKGAVSFTISAKFMEEFTLDGRSDKNAASVFQFETIEPIQIELKENDIKENENDQNDSLFIDSTNNWIKFGNDIRDLSFIFYYIDTFWDIKISEFKEMKALNKELELINKIAYISYSLPTTSNNKILNEILVKINSGINHPNKIGISKSKPNDTNTDKLRKDLNEFFTELNFLALEMDKISKKMKTNFNSEIEFNLNSTSKSTYDKKLYKYIIEVVNLCDIKVRNTSKNRNNLAPYIVLLHSIRSKLTNYRKLKENLKNDKIEMIEASDIVNKIEKILHKTQIMSFTG